MFESYFSDSFASVSGAATGIAIPQLASPPRPAMPIPQTRSQWSDTLGSLLGPPQPTRPNRDQIVSDIWSGPYRSPYDGIDPYGRETPRMVAHYNEQYRDHPIVHSAIRGKADDICILEPAILAQDRNNPVESKAAEFLKWTISHSPGGWFGLFDQILTPGIVNGWSVGEKKRKVVKWKGQIYQGMGHVRNLDTALIRLELDVYRNVLSIVNMVRGLEYYAPDDVVLYSHNPMYSNPFGQSDVRSVTRNADIIQEAYRVWFVAMKIYGLPYMIANGPATNKLGLETILEELRSGGYAVLGPEDKIEVLNLAGAAGTQMFQDFVHTNREDIFFGIRGVAQPFMEGKGGQDSHTDTDIQQGTSDAGEAASGKRLEACINEQIIPWLVIPNFGEIDMPFLTLGGTDWKQINDIVDLYERAQKIGAKPSAEQFYLQTSIIPQRDEADSLTPPQACGPPGQPGAPGAGGMPGQGGPPQLGAGKPDAGPQPAPSPTPPAQMASTFSADHRPQNSEIDPAMVARVVDRLLAEELSV